MYTNLPLVSPNHSSSVRAGGLPPSPLLPPPRTKAVSDSNDKDYDYPETGMSDSYVDVDEYDEASLLNGVR